MLGWNLPPNFENGFTDCYNASIYTTVFNYAKQYPYLFGCHFGFHYDPIDGQRKLENRFQAGGLADDRDDMLCRITGLRTMEQEAQSIEELLDRAHSQVREGHPVTIKVDAYDCPWNIAYQKTHFEHYLCFLGKDEEGDLWGHDAFCGVNRVKLPDLDHLHISKQYLTYRYNPDDITIRNPLLILREAMHYYIQKKCANAIFDFAQELLDNRTLYEELKDSGVLCINAFFIKLKGIVSNRLNFRYFLMESSLPDTSHLVSSFQAACICWYEAYRVFNKYMFRKGNVMCLSAACNKMKEAALIEERCAADYLQVKRSPKIKGR